MKRIEAPEKENTANKFILAIDLVSEINYFIKYNNIIKRSPLNEIKHY
jgi:hypothetical protein